VTLDDFELCTFDLPQLMKATNGSGANAIHPAGIAATRRHIHPTGACSSRITHTDRTSKCIQLALHHTMAFEDQRQAADQASQNIGDKDETNGP